MDLLLICPMLIAQNLEQTVFDGFITVQGQDYQIHVKLEEKNSVRGAQIDCEWKLKHLLRGYETIIQQRMNQCSSLPSFMVEFTSIIESQLNNRKQARTEPQPPRFYRQLLEEVEQIGWEKLTFIDTTFQQLYFSARDSHCRHHTLKIHLHPTHPAKSPDCLTELPSQHDFIWTSQSKLADLYGQFVKCLEGHQDFWNMLDEIDKETWVLEPEKPTRNATSRRIALGNTASLQLEVDAKYPRMLPECRFLGADHVINPLRDNLNRNLDNWNPQLSLLKNLELALEVDFPSPQNTKKEDFSIECGICYAYRLEDQIPDQACNDPRCGQPFHHACLLEWLRSLPSSRQSFNVVFGECPYCSKPITVKVLTR